MSQAMYSIEESRRLAVACTAQGALFGVDTEPVQEIVRVGHITPVHHAPSYVVGIMNLRGRIVTVMDLGLKLQLGATPITPDSRILIVAWQGESLGLLIERELGVVNVDHGQLKPAPENVRGVQSAMLEGICMDGEHAVALLNLTAVLAIEEERARA